MKLQFEPNLDYQLEAIASITDLFEGQEVCQSHFSVPLFDEKGLYAKETEFGYGNKLQLLDEEILENLKKIQLRNGLKPTEKLDSLDFTIEMETGTGKTYVYLRTIFELHKRYNFTKFIIVVPSIAIKEGVYKSLQITEEHFKAIYQNTPYDYFIYNSQNLEQVRSFATSDTIQIMVINIDAFRKSFSDPTKEDKANIIHRQNDRLNGYRPIDLIASCSPIVIIDEPQSVDTTSKAKEAIVSLGPLCTFRYSATHRDKYNMVYKLDPVDAYQRQLVKQIEVASIDVEEGNNKAYIKLLGVDNTKHPIRAKIEIDKVTKAGVKRKVITVKQGDDLFELSGGRDVYSGYIINDIYCTPMQECITFTSKEEFVELGKAIGDVDQDEVKRLQIRKTIEEHLEKELRLKSRGIKVLSLFFIDKVSNYRTYDENGNPQKGKFAIMFEEELKKLIKLPKYCTLFKDIDVDVEVEKVHNGYFAVDSKGRAKDSSGKTKDDESVYNLIMKDKERLLSFDTPLRFIFSHSALREGWDNPNVFQICTLNESNSVIKKRQEIGRGLRLAVNQKGERVYGFEVNTLTIMANESYESFAKGLQKEIEKDTGIRFGVIEEHTFASVITIDEDGEEHYLGVEKSEELYRDFLQKGYIDRHGKIQDSLKLDLKNDSLDLPLEFVGHKPGITAILKKIAGSLNVKNADDRKPLKLNKAVYLSDDFKALWDKIKYKTTYRVEFDEEKLIEACAKKISEKLIVSKTRFRYTKAVADIRESGVEAESVREDTFVYGVRDYKLPDIVSFLQNETNLTRKAIVDILLKSGKLEMFKNNPQKFIDDVLKIIKTTMQGFIVDGIKYQKIGEDAYYSQEIFEKQELIGYLKKNMVKSEKSVYDYVLYDSTVEKSLAESFEKNESVKLYAKLPADFKIETPIGPYNPDWAVLIEKERVERLYFVVETKGTLFDEMLRPTEKAKIDCGKAHFDALQTGVEYFTATTMDDIENEFLT